MNKRIRQLAQEAGMYVDLNGNPWPKWMSGEECEAAYKKFAELIVAECIDTALEQKKWVEDQEVFNPQDEQWNRARIQQSQHIVDKIKQHFGVE